MRPSGSSPPRGRADSRSFGSLLDYFLECRDATLDLLHAVHPQGEHPVHHRLIADFRNRGATQNHPADFGRKGHDLVEAGPALIASATASIAAAALHERERL